MSELQEINFVNIAVDLMVPDDTIPKKMNLTHREEQLAYLRVAQRLAVVAIKELGGGEHDKFNATKARFLHELENTLNVIGNYYERSQPH